jgi:hypothetical protein
MDLWPGVDWGRARDRLVDDGSCADATSTSAAIIWPFWRCSSGKTNLLRTLLLSLAATHA